MRKYKTVNNLRDIWLQLDNACGSLDNALVDLDSMVGLPDEIKEKAERVDFGEIVNLKNQIEDLIKKQINT